MKKRFQHRKDNFVKLTMISFLITVDDVQDFTNLSTKGRLNGRKLAISCHPFMNMSINGKQNDLKSDLVLQNGRLEYRLMVNYVSRSKVKRHRVFENGR